MSTTLRFTKDDLIDALEGRRKWAEAGDDLAVKKHLADEKAWHRKFTARCRELAKMSYPELKEIGDRGSYNYFRDVDSTPRCPMSRVAKLDRQLNIVRAARQATFAVSSGGQWSDAFWLLTHDDEIHADICS